jgi:putative multiple sugar transport system substrate-binding protein
VISAVDGSAFVDVLAKAAQKQVKVIAYDRLLLGTKNVDAQATFDNVKVGVMQGQLLADKLGLSGGEKGPFNVELFAGSPTDANARSFYNGAITVLKPYIQAGKIVVPSGQTKFDDVAIDKYDAALTQTRMTKLLKANYQNTELNAVLSPYDGQSMGIVRAVEAAGYGTTDKPMPIISGQDAELPSVQAILDGKQTATIYKDTRELAKAAVQMGNALLTGAKPLVNDTTSFKNGVRTVPTYLLYPVNVDKTNYKILLVDGKYYTQKEIDTPVKPAA